MLNKSVDLWRCLILGCGEQMCGSIRMCYFGLFGLCWTNSWIYSDALFGVLWTELNKFVDLCRCLILGCLGCVEQIRGSIWMRYFGLFGWSWTNPRISSDALFWIVWVELNKFVGLFGWVILGCLGCVEQIRGSILMRYFGLFVLCWTNPWIFADALFWVVVNKCANLFGCVIFGCLGCVEQIHGSIRMGYFGLFGLCWTNSWIYSDALFWVDLVMLNKFVDLFGRFMNSEKLIWIKETKIKLTVVKEYENIRCCL